MDELEQAGKDQSAPFGAVEASARRLADLVMAEAEQDEPGPTALSLRDLAWALDAFFDALPSQDDRDLLSDVFFHLLAIGNQLAERLGVRGPGASASSIEGRVHVMRRLQDPEHVHDLLADDKQMQKALHALESQLSVWRVMDKVRDAGGARHMDEYYQEMHWGLAAALCDVMHIVAADGIKQSTEQAGGAR